MNMKQYAALGVMTIGLSLGATWESNAQEINFGIIATEASQNQKVAWEPYLKAMTDATGLKINGFYASDYAGVIEAMRFNKVQVAWYGNKSAMEAVDRSQGEVFAQVISADGGLGYYAHLITNVSKPFEKLDDVLKCDKSLDFGIGDPNSTSGFLVPTTYIFAAKGIDPKTCFKTVRNASHQVNAMSAANNLVDVATNNSEDLQRLEASAPDARKKIKIIWTSPLIPLDPIVWRKDLDPAVKAKVYNFVLSYGRTGTPDEIKAAKEILAKLIWSPLKPSSNHQLLPIRTLEANKKIFKIQSDEKLSAEDKKKQIVEVQIEVAKLAELQKKADADATVKGYSDFTKLDPVKDAAQIKSEIANFQASLAQMAY